METREELTETINTEFESLCSEDRKKVEDYIAQIRENKTKNKESALAH